MVIIFSALFCLGLSLHPRTQAQTGSLPKPILWAEPGPLVPWKSSVTLWCQGTQDVQKFRLDKNQNSAPWGPQSPLESRDRANFSITHMTQFHTGRYRCLYLSRTGWSMHSDPLELVMLTASYSTPSLSALPSPVVSSGGTVTLQCGSGQEFDRMVLTQEGEHKSSWLLDTQPQPNGQVQALFLVGPMTPSHRWTFRCHGYYRSSPQVWSPPSKPLELLVSAPAPQDYTVGNSIRMGAGGLVLLALLAVLVQSWRTRERPQWETRVTDLNPGPGWREWSCPTA